MPDYVQAHTRGTQHTPPEIRVHRPPGAPEFNAVARFEFHEQVLATPLAMQLLWGRRITGGGGRACRDRSRWGTAGSIHDVTGCEIRCAEHHGDRYGWVHADRDAILATTAPRIDFADLESYELDGGEAEMQASYPGADYETFCNVGVALCFGQAYGGENLWRNRWDANGMVDEWSGASGTGAAGWHVIPGSEWAQARDIADAGGYVWAGVPRCRMGHVWALTSAAEKGVEQAADRASIPAFHFGSGKPRRSTNADEGGDTDRVRFFVPTRAFERWTQYLERAGEDGVRRAKEQVRAAVEASRAAERWRSPGAVRTDSTTRLA